MLLTYPKIRSMQVLVVIKKKRISDKDKKTKTKIITVQFKEFSKEDNQVTVFDSTSRLNSK